MAKTKVKALVIDSKDSKEKDKLVTLFSLEEGKLFVYFRGVKSEKAKLKAAKEIFTFGEFVIEEGKSGNIVTEVEIIDSFLPLRNNIDKFFEACSILDIVKKLSKNEGNAFLFIEMVKALKAVAYDEAPQNYSLVKFLISIFNFSGYALNFEECAGCKAKLTGKKFFNFEYGEFVCANCKNLTSLEVAPATISALKLLKSTPYEKLNSLKLGGSGELKALNLLSENFEWRFGSKFFTKI